MHDTHLEDDETLQEDFLDDDKQKPKRRRTDISFITDKSKRNVCFAKRKRGLMKKAAELGKLTGCHIFVCVANDDEVHTLSSEKLLSILSNENSRKVVEGSLGLEETTQLQEATEDAKPDDVGNYEIQIKLQHAEEKNLRKRHITHELPPAKKIKLVTQGSPKQQQSSPTLSTHQSTIPQEYSDPFYRQLPLRHPHVAFVNNPVSSTWPQQQKESHMIQTIFTNANAPLPTLSNSIYIPPTLAPAMTTYTNNSALSSTPLELKLNVEQDLLEQWAQQTARRS